VLLPVESTCKPALCFGSYFDGTSSRCIIFLNLLLHHGSGATSCNVLSGSVGWPLLCGNVFFDRIWNLVHQLWYRVLPSRLGVNLLFELCSGDIFESDRRNLVRCMHLRAIPIKHGFNIVRNVLDWNL
jgi:hypothetical protein